jgi:hypothetical protein
LPTKDHFSSTGTLAVRGGKPDQLVMEVAGVPAGASGVACGGILGDADESPGLSDAAAVGEVGEDGECLRIGESGVEQRCALAFGKAGPAGAAVQEPPVLLAVAGADGEGVGPAFPVRGAVGVLGAEARQVVRRRTRGQSGGWGCHKGLYACTLRRSMIGRHHPKECRGCYARLVMPEWAVRSSVGSMCGWHG